MPTTDPTIDELKTFHVDGASALTMVEYMKQYHNANPGGGSTQIAAPVLSVEFADTGDYVTVTNNTDYDLVSGGNVLLGYTTDGTIPTQYSNEFVSPKDVYLNGILTVRAFLVLSDGNYIPSPASALNITGLKCQKPVFSYDSSMKQVTMTCPTPGAVIRYTTDGSSTPTETTGTAYNGPITVSANTTFIIKAFKTGIASSDTVSGSVTVGQIICVSFPINGNAGTRITPSTDPLGLVTETITTEPVPEIPGPQEGSSPFDQYDPWQKRRCNFQNGAFKCWDDDTAFSTTEYDTMVHYPENTYIKLALNSDADTEYYYLSSRPFEGFEKAPWAGYYGAVYETSNNNESKSGKTVQVDQSIATMRTNARAKGDGWNQLDAVMHAADQWLFMVEYASRDCQAKIGQGISSTSTKHKTGETDVLEYHTGRCAGADTICAVRYRWSENLWGNVYEWCDGVQAIESGKIYVTDNPELYGATNNSGWTLAFEISPDLSASNYIRTFNHNSAVDWCCFVPKEEGTSEENAAPDYTCYYMNSNRFLYVSGYCWGGSECGLWCFCIKSTVYATANTLGGRLTYREPNAA